LAREEKIITTKQDLLDFIDILYKKEGFIGGYMDEPAIYVDELKYHLNRLIPDESDGKESN